jgi:hypothetical protein
MIAGSAQPAARKIDDTSRRQRTKVSYRLNRIRTAALDSFSGDSIAVHLLTREAFAMYFRTHGWPPPYSVAMSPRTNLADR